MRFLSNPWARRVGYICLALVAFVFGMQWTFPLERVKSKIESELGGSYEATIGEIKRGVLPGNVSLRKVMLQPKKVKPSDPQWIMFIDSVDLDVGMFAFLKGKIVLDVTIQIGQGELEASIDVSSKTMHVAFEGQHLPGEKLPILSELLGGPPLVGKLKTSGKLSMARDNWTTAVGSFQFGCEGPCTFGDGKAKFKPRTKQDRQAVFVGEGFTWGEVRIAAFDFVIEAKGGKASITSWNFTSPDAHLEAEFAVTLAKQLGASTIDKGCFKYKAMPELAAREAQTADAILLTGGALDSTSGLFHVTVKKGELSESRAVSKLCTEGDARPLSAPSIRPTQIDARPADMPAPMPTPTPSAPPPVAPAPSNPSPYPDPPNGSTDGVPGAPPAAIAAPPGSSALRALRGNETAPEPTATGEPTPAVPPPEQPIE